MDDKSDKKRNAKKENMNGYEDKQDGSVEDRAKI